MLGEWLTELTGVGLFDFRLFRAGSAALVAAALVFFSMPSVIRALIRLDATSDFAGKTSATPPPPILGGLVVVLAIICATLAFAKPNGYVVSILVILIAYSSVGAADDIMKIRNKRRVAKGLMSKEDYKEKADGLSARFRLALYLLFSFVVAIVAYKLVPGMTGHLTVPFVKPQIWHPYLPNWAFVGLICLVITSTANGANFTDGLDTLVTVPIITTATFVGIVAYVSGNAVFSEYFLVPHLPGVDELLPVAASIVGGMLAYLWYNCPPAEIYMGDAGAIGIGGAIGMMFVLIKAELFLPIVGIIFLAEATSVLLQITGFKLTRRFSADRTGRRLFLRAPLHDHFRLKLQGRYSDARDRTSKVTWRFHLISVLALVIGSLIFFKVR